MPRRKFFSLLFVTMSASLGYAQEAGKYIGSVQTEWLEPDRKMRLLAPFTFIDPNGVEWQAPRGWVIDGASIPRFAWSVVGGPFDGKYRNASVIHDVACDQKKQPWESVHEAFYWAMLASDVEPWRAKVMYAAVYHFGPRWPRTVTVSGVPTDQTPDAREQALSQAEPGSEAAIVEVRPQPRSAAEVQAQQPASADVDVQIQPPPSRLSQNDFEKLKAKIMEVEAAPSSPNISAPSRTRGIARGGGGGGGAGGSAESPSAPGGQPFGGSRSAARGVSLDEIRGFQSSQ